MEIKKIKCPCCGANLDVSPNDRKITCSFCGQTSILEKDETNQNSSNQHNDLIDTANSLLDMNEYLKAKKQFTEYTQQYPDNYEGWWGLLRCKSRDFTIKDNNAVFENELNKYLDNFRKTAPRDILEEKENILKYYLNPELRAEEERLAKLSQEQKIKEEKKRLRQERLANKYPNGKPKVGKSIIWTIFMGLSALVFLTPTESSGSQPLVSIFFALSAVLPLNSVKEKLNLKTSIAWVGAIALMIIGVIFMK